MKSYSVISSSITLSRLATYAIVNYDNQFSFFCAGDSEKHHHLVNELNRINSM
jgi:hypothetical protein